MGYPNKQTHHISRHWVGQAMYVTRKKYKRMASDVR